MSAETCAACPLCALMAALRGERPELVQRLAEHLGGLVTLLRSALDEPAEPAAAGAHRVGQPEGRAADPGRAPGVRPVVAVTLTVGVDVGGTSVRAGVVNGDGTVLDTARTPTPPSEAALEAAVAGVVRTLAEPAPGRGRRARAGRVHHARPAGASGSRRTCRGATPRWPTGIGDRIGLPVVVEHDANAAALAERYFGAASGAATAVFVALGTGIGSALLLDGVLFRGAFGVAPELGHLQVVPDGRPCPCGKTGCWERYCSGTALATTAVELMARDPGQLAVAVAAGGGRPPPGDRPGRGGGGAGRRSGRHARRWRTSRGGWGWGWRSSPTSSTPSWW